MDIKDENIVIDDQLTAKLLDFGSARLVPSSESDYFTELSGSVLYAAPELLRGDPYAGPAVDMWALGVLLYLLAFAKLPFQGSHQTLQGSFVILPNQRDPLILRLITQLLDKDPTQRLNSQQLLSFLNHS